MAGARASVYCLDASACALRSEDYTATTRWHFQRELVTVHSGAAARQPSAGVAVVAAAGGRASVALHPTTDAEALQVALREVQPDGEASLEAALKLALLVSRRFPAGRTHVTAFVASSGAAASLAQHPAAAKELRQRFAAAAVSLDVAVLCTSQELGADCTAVLQALTGGDAATASSGSSAGGSEGESPPPSSATRLLWLSPVDTAAESWQQLEPALEQLEGGPRRSSSDIASNISTAGASAGASGGGISSGGSGDQSALPRRISRAPRQLPRTSLLAARSGVQQPALCRGESLSRFGHLSSDGMARPWLPTYASLGQAAKSAAAAASAGTGSTAEMCYVEVQPLPRWRTLIKVAAGRMLPAPTDGSRPGSGNYASASSQLLRSLEALNVLDDEPDSKASSSEDGSSSSGSDAGSNAGSSSDAEAAAAAAPPPAVRYVPDSTRGTLRLLQGTKEPHLLKLVWQADRGDRAAADLAAGSSQDAAQQRPLDMFGSAGGSAPGSSGASSARAAHLAYMPAATAAASAARGPILREGCELWEAAAEFDWELTLPTAQSGSTGTTGSTSSASGSTANPAATFEARQLPNGAQLLMVAGGSASSRAGGSGGLARLHNSKPAAAFWLQQGLGPDSLQLPAYGTAPSSTPSSEAAAAEDAAAPSGTQPEPAQPAQAEGQQAAGEAATGPAALLASALQRLVAQPPVVDLRRLRKDVKSGAIQVTPITVGPLPAQFVRDIVGARSALMSSLGMENMDSWGDSSGQGSSESAQPGGSAAAGGASSSAGGRSGNGAEASGAAAAGSSGGGNEQGEKRPAPKPAAVMLQQHRSAALSLLRQRLSKLHSGKSSGSSTASEAPPPPAQPAAADEDSGSAAAGAECEGMTAGDACTPPKPARACSLPMATPAPPTAGSCSSSVADTPFGTPMSILPSCLLHQNGGGAPDEASVDGDGEAAAAGAAGASHGQDHGLPNEGGQLLDAKQDGPVLVGAPSQGEAGDHSDHTLFQIE